LNKPEKKKARDLKALELFVILFAEKRLDSSLYIEDKES
jgi:hypothetical protein